MMFGAEGLIGLVNLLALAGVIALVALVFIYARYRKYKAERRLTRATKIALSASALVSAPFALLTLAFLIFFVYDWASERPARLEFERNNDNRGALTKAIQDDDLEVFMKAIDRCGIYCVQPEKGKKKYDDLIGSIGQGNSPKVKALLEQWNEKELVVPFSERELQNQRAAKCISQRLAKKPGDPEPNCDTTIQWLTFEADK